MFHDKTILLTGVGGFVGSHLAEALLLQGANVIGVDNFITGQRSNLEAEVYSSDRFQLLEADVIQAPENYLPEKYLDGSIKIDVVLHFASPASPPRYQAHPVATYQVNTLATHHLAQFLLKTNPAGRLLFAGTSEAYGDPAVHPQPESYWGNVNPNGPRSCYDEAKRLGETICGVHFRDFGLDTRIVRIFNTYGPKMDPADGRVIPNFVTQVMAGQPMSIFGDGQQTRSYCYVSDLVGGILKFAAADTLAGETINLGNPDEYTVKQTAEIIFQHIRQQPAAEADFSSHPMPVDDPSRRQPDITKAKELLGWQPSVSLQDGLAKTIAYFSENQAGQ